MVSSLYKLTTKNTNLTNDLSLSVVTSFVMAPKTKGVDKKPRIRAGCVLMDPGSSRSIVRSYFAIDSSKTTVLRNTWRTPAGSFSTTIQKTITFKLVEFSSSKTITWPFSVVGHTHDIGYDMIIGRDLLFELGLIIDFEKRLCHGQNVLYP